MAEISAFSQASTRAIGQSKIFLVEKLRQSDDWPAQAFLLERRWPNEFGRSDARPLPKEPEPDRQGPLVSFILSMPDGTQRETTLMRQKRSFAGIFPDAISRPQTSPSWATMPETLAGATKSHENISARAAVSDRR